MTVFDLAPSSGQVASATALNITAGAAVGTLLQSAAGNNVVIAGTAPVGTPIAAPLSYTILAAPAQHVITDLIPGTGYSVSVAMSGVNQVVSVTLGGSRITTANGVLTFQVNASGQVTP
jgi:hypothetical protein